MSIRNRCGRGLRCLVVDERGATTVEYALIATIASLAILTGGIDLGTMLMRSLQSLPLAGIAVETRTEETQ
jgi:Flp pilus assembly pilin Flp